MDFKRALKLRVMQIELVLDFPKKRRKMKGRKAHQTAQVTSIA